MTTTETLESDAAQKSTESGYYPLPDKLLPVFYPEWALQDTPEAKLFQALYFEVEYDYQPQTIFESMDVVEITHVFWQQQDVQKNVRNIVRSARGAGLFSLLTSVLGDVERAQELVKDYYANPEKRKTVMSVLAAHGFDAASIDAVAMAHRALILPPLTRMSAALGVRRDKLVDKMLKRKAERGDNVEQSKKSAPENHDRENVQAEKVKPTKSVLHTNLMKQGHSNGKH